MNRFAGLAAQNKSASRSVSELHLCNNLRHLMFALADILGRSAQATIIYLEDDAQLSKSLRMRISETYPHIRLLVSTDAAQIAEFGGIDLTGLMRRNLRFDGVRGFTRSTRWALPMLTEQRFDIGFIYHTGLFSAKSAAFSCDHVVMRESGLNNYVALPVPWPKAVVRACVGLPPFRQVWGEERWVDVIEVSRPEYLPARVQAKARGLTFAKLLGSLDEKQALTLGRVFVPTSPELNLKPEPRAVVLTQAIDDAGLCTSAEKKAIYQGIVDVLQAQGYDIHVKHHPTETPYSLTGCTTFDANFPVELWATLGLPRFNLAVALCSAALIEGEALLAKKVVQLITPAQFNVAGVRQWRATLPDTLAVLKH